MKFYLVCYKDGNFEHKNHFIDECFANDFVNYLRNNGFEGEIKFKTYDATLEKEEVV